jgi:hypothetical protein
LVASLFFLVVALFALRSNNLTMLKLKDEVYAADKNNGDVEAAMHKLREYVYQHMNTDLAGGPGAIRPPLQLKYRYERLVAGERQRVANVNANVYTQAQAACERQIPQGVSGGGRVQCIKDYVARNGAHEKQIPDALYKFDFVSPAWSPDLAGWTLVLSAIFGLLFAVRILLGWWFKRELHTHQ